MAVFVDTSGVYALLDASDRYHRLARSVWDRLSEHQERLVTSNYILVETMALMGRRFGIQAIRDIQNDFLPLLNIIWVDESLHRRAVAALLTAGLRDLSVVDCVSFEIMRDRSISAAFAFDDHFEQQGFTCLS